MKLFSTYNNFIFEKLEEIKRIQTHLFAEKVFFFFFYSPVAVLLVSKEEFNQIHPCEVFSAMHDYGMIAILRIYRKVSSVLSKSTQYLMNGFLIFLCFIKKLKFSARTYLEFNLLRKKQLTN